MPLYPSSSPLATHTLDVGHGHTVYVEEGGNPAGIPVVFLHGGPGSGCKPGHRQFFDPTRYRSFLIDQRGAGRSTPLGEINHNTTQWLIDDLERLRDVAGVEQWVLFGGSWGAALALAYAETHPERVLGIVLRGSFLARERDLAWFVQDGAARLLPVAWAEYSAAVRDIGETSAALYGAITGSDRAIAERVARAWFKWSTEVVMFPFDQVVGDPPEPLDVLLAKARIELHYAYHRYFLRENQLLEDVHCLPNVPVHLIHGQRDLTCTADASFTLSRAIPGSTLEILRNAGHLSSETPVADALVRAADAMARKIRGD